MIAILMELLATVAGLAQLKALLSSAVIISPVARLLLLYVVPVAPAMTAPFFFHTYCGLLPPLVMALLKLTWVPAHTVLPGLAVMVMVGVTEVTTVSVAVADVLVVLQLPLITTRYWLPLRPGVALLICRLGVVTPE